VTQASLSRPRSFINNTFSDGGGRERSVPDIRSDKHAWFDFWDSDRSGTLEQASGFKSPARSRLERCASGPYGAGERCASDLYGVGERCASGLYGAGAPRPGSKRRPRGQEEILRALIKTFHLSEDRDKASDFTRHPPALPFPIRVPYCTLSDRAPPPHTLLSTYRARPGHFSRQVENMRNVVAAVWAVSSRIPAPRPSARARPA